MRMRLFVLALNVITLTALAMAQDAPPPPPADGETDEQQVLIHRMQETAPVPAPASPRSYYDVLAFGAKGDGVTDDTDAFQKALNAAAADGGGVVRVPAGRFLIKTHLDIPMNVTLQGIWTAPSTGIPPEAGTVLLAVEGQGNPDGTPFITVHTGSTLSGLNIFYPEQIKANPPHPYPWTVQSVNGTDNCAILNVTMINPYKAVDFGTYMTGRHYINGLYAHALNMGLYINQCYDVGRIENIHFWPFWDLDPNSPLWVYTKENATAFLIGRTDGELAFNCFSIFYKRGMHFIRGPIGDTGKTGPGSGVYTNCYMDITPNAVLVDDVGETAGISFVNSMFMSGIHVSPSNKGEVKFTACGFWANKDQQSHAVLAGRGTVFFNSCHFSRWDRPHEGHPAIDANNARIVVNGCEFFADANDAGLKKVRLGPDVRAAIITSNIMQGGIEIENNAPTDADVQIGFNTGK